MSRESTRGSGRVGVCSWSLLPQSPTDLCARVKACGLAYVQLALEPIRSGAWPLHEVRSALHDAGIGVLSGMFEPAGEDYTSLESIARTGGLRDDGLWSENLDRAKACAVLAAELGLPLVTFHAGILPHDPRNPERRIMIDRLRAIATIFANQGIRIALETGQEDARTLLHVLLDLDRPDVGINFDPANVILYGSGDPIEALSLLAPRVIQAHIKDAIPTTSPGAWGAEVPVGRGRVAWAAFFHAIARTAPHLNLLIEREAGTDRVADILAAADLVRAHGWRA